MVDNGVLTMMDIKKCIRSSLEAADVTVLDGLWDFAVIPGGHVRDAEPEKTVFNGVTPVPGCFNLPETPFFNRHSMAVYRTRVECSGLVRLRIGALGLRGRIFWDGTEIGSTELPYSVWQKVFDSGAAGVHQLVVAVDDQFAVDNNTVYFPYYDFYGFGGIYGSVSIEALPEYYLDNIHITSLDYHTGLVRIRLMIGGKLPPEGYPAGLRFDGGETEALILSGREVVLERHVPGFRLRSPETPELHTLSVKVGSHFRSTEFGIRVLEWKDGFKLNGRSLKLIGYNRHESHPEFGAATPFTLVYNDLKMIKDQGCNFIRGSHYPQSEEMLSICDRLGLMVWNESLGWGNKLAHLLDPGFMALQKEQTGLMVAQSYNHPSIILWGFLNEAETQYDEARPAVKMLCDTIRAIDTSRPVSFASNRGETDRCLDFVDIVAFNTYPGWYDPDAECPLESGLGRIDAALSRRLEFCRESQPGKSMLISEIGAAAIYGDHSGWRWSEEYQADLFINVLKFVKREPLCIGVAMWQFCNINTSMAFPVMFIIRPRGFNNKGVVDEYRRPKMAWRAIKRFLDENREDMTSCRSGVPAVSPPRRK